MKFGDKMKNFFYKLKMTFEYVKDKEIPFYRKLLIIIAFTYFIFPVDIVPDFIIGIGLLDDVAVLAFIWAALKSEINEYITKKEIQKIDKSKVIEFKKVSKDKKSD